ncbi:branched-chain amino acid ABC transporter permease [Paracoccus aestuariivivens]|uniref:Branched-chain amino acid ABC transporter permease n=1 Tax=Paracoccus aestuariivivens TaxID=1820333 RepID=A0A6L6JDM9_9RHOB|nr:branched-chain amino acid ABC transporter permease [Paracoccus aestuariivivens]MTH80090.1 branched-chain amino acid ABC transporter permease [Paracoccus aestuariivivens]
MTYMTQTLTEPRAGLAARLKLALAIFALLAVVPPLAHAMGEPFMIIIATRMMVFAIAALSLDLILGHGAMVSFGHAAYLGFGSYAVAILSRAGISDLVLQMVAAVLASALFALVTGAISLRTRGVYFIMITLAFGQMAYFFFVSFSALGGDDGVALAARSTVLGLPLLQGETGLFYVTLGLLIAAFAGLYLLTRSRFGRVLTGTRESALRMQAIGFRPLPYQLTAYVISAAICGVAGVLLANQAVYVSPAYMSWHRSGEMIVMLVLGGVGSLTGAMTGALVTVALEEGLARFSEHWRLGFGLILVLVALLSPGGLSGLLRKFNLLRDDK